MIGDDLAVPVLQHAPARSVTEVLRASHGAGHPGRVQDALTAHPTVPDGLLRGPLDRQDRPADPPGGWPGRRRSSVERVAHVALPEGYGASGAAGISFLGSMNGIAAVVPTMCPCSDSMSMRVPGSASSMGTQT